MTDRARRSLASASPAALLAATAPTAGLSLRHDRNTSGRSRALRVVAR